MRTLFAFLFALLAGQVSGQIPSPWIQQTSGTFETLQAVHFTSFLNGYTVGDNGTALKTTDGGDSWNPMPGLPMDDLVSVAFSDPDTGYILPAFGGISITHDGGNSWFLDTLKFAFLCEWEKASIDQDGLVYFLYKGCFGNNEIFSWNTTTGDTTTYRIYETFDYLEAPRDIDFPEAGTAVVVGDSGMILRTTNGGDTWSNVSVPDTSAQFKAIDFMDADTGFAVTHDEFWPLWKTVDGGASWGIDSSWVQTFFYPEFNDMEVMPGRTGYLAGMGQGQGLVFKNNFWGGSWAFPNALMAVDMLADSMAWVVGELGFIGRIGDPLLLSTSEPVYKPQELTLYPNPATDYFALEWPDFDFVDAEVVLYNIQGKAVRQANVSAANPRVDMTGISPGMYLVRMKIGDELVSGKIFKN